MLEVWPVGQIDGHLHLVPSLLGRGPSHSVASRLVPQRRVQALAKRDADVLGGVVVVYE